MSTFETQVTNLCHTSLRRRQAKEPFFYGMRTRALEAFEGAGLPHPRAEEYRYTPLAKRLYPLFAQELHRAEQVPAKIPSPVTAELPGYHLTFYNGYLVDQKVPQGETPYHILSFAEAYMRYPDLITQYFHRQAGEVYDPFVALNTVLFTPGYFIYLPPHVELEKPLILHYHSHGTLPTTIQPRVLLVADSHSSAAVVETVTSSGGPILSCRVAEIVLEENAKLTHYALQAGAQLPSQLRYTYVQQAAYSYFAHYLLANAEGSSLVRDMVSVQLIGEKSHATLRGLYHNRGDQHLALHTQARHLAPETSSMQQYKGVGEDLSTALFDGHIHIQSAAQRSVARQHHQGLLRSAHAAIHARPQLAIHADDVQCSHGVTTSQLDPDALFYMQAHGIPYADAEKMLLHSFLQEIITTIPHPTIQALAHGFIYRAYRRLQIEIPVYFIISKKTQ